VKNKIETQLMQNWFYMLVDEVTDNSRTKFVAIMIQYAENSKNIKSYLYALNDVKGRIGAQGLYEILNESLLEILWYKLC